MAADWALMKCDADPHAATAAAWPSPQSGGSAAGTAEAPVTQPNNQKCQRLINWAQVQLGKGQAWQQTSEARGSAAA